MFCFPIGTKINLQFFRAWKKSSQVHHLLFEESAACSVSVHFFCKPYEKSFLTFQSSLKYCKSVFNLFFRRLVYLSNVRSILDLHGWNEVLDPAENFSLLWSYDDPYTAWRPIIQKLQPHQVCITYQIPV